MRSRILCSTCRLAVLLILLSAAVRAQDSDATDAETQHVTPATGEIRKQATAMRVEGGVIQLDGRLDESAWERADPITDFIQKEPDEGTPPTEPMEVRFLYDGSALYVGARMYSADPSSIQAPLGRRDEIGVQAEHVFVSLDTFLDRRTAYTFGVSASGVRLDRYHRSDSEFDADREFDPVWEARSRIDELGWTAELWIPFTQLRFSNRQEQVWGLNVRRFIPTLEEQDYWVLVPRTERAWASRFGDLRGIRDIAVTRRIELVPYVAGSSLTDSGRDPDNPFVQAVNLAGRAGLDFKMGLGPNLTLDAAVNPDFGQVEADPAEVNLTEFETRFSERRSFFREGTQLLNVGPNFLYTRRIGARPSGDASGDYVDYPNENTILGAAKITGRLDSGTSIGLLAAVTDEENARISDAGLPDVARTRVAPQSTFGIATVQQEFGELGSTTSAGFGFVHRGLEADDPLAAELVRNYLSASSETNIRLKGGEYEIGASGVGMFMTGDAAAIEDVQRSSVSYFQRPDRADGRIVDPARTSLSGGAVSASVSRVNGRHWLFDVNTKFESAGFNTNSLGLMTRADGIEPSVTIRYRETQPGRIFRRYQFALNKRDEWNWSGNHYSGSIRPSVDLTWNNFWTTNLDVSFDERGSNTTMARGGPRVGTPRGWDAAASLGNSRTAQTRWWGRVTLGSDEHGGGRREFRVSLSARPSPRWELSIQPFYQHLTSSQQYVTALDDGPAETFGRRYIFSFIERSTLSAELRTTFTLKPDMTLDVYAEPFAASGRFYDYGELVGSAARDRLTYGTAGTTIVTQTDGSRLVTAGGSSFTLDNDDFNIRSFRSNVVLRWEWTPGSTLFVVWQQDRRRSEAFGATVGPGDLFGSVSAPGSNVFLIKTSFWIPVG